MASEDGDNGRQLKNLKGLLSFCGEGTTSEDAQGNSQMEPMTEERRQWLEEAMASAIAGDPVNVIRNMLAVLKVETDSEKVVEALDILLDYSDDLDLANSVHDLGGFDVLHSLIKSERPLEVQRSLAALLAALAQNNPRWQEELVDENVIMWLLKNLHGEESTTVLQTKSLSALSAVARGYPSATIVLLDHDGLKIIVNCLSSSHQPLVTKAAFLLASLSSPEEGSNVADRLISCGVIAILISALQRWDHNEQLARLLYTLIVNGPQEAKQQAIAGGAVNVIKQKQNPIKNLEEYQEEYEYYTDTLHCLCGKA